MSSFQLKVNFELVSLQRLSGNGATIYAVAFEGEIDLFEQFLRDNKSLYGKEVKSIVQRLSTIGRSTGARAEFFKEKEGRPGDGVCALYDDPGSKLRLFCIRYGMNLVILGGGGPKPKEIKAWEDDEKLRTEAENMIAVSAAITARIKEGELKFVNQGYDFEGDLRFFKNDD